jgi:hypothetical protein
VARLGSSWSVTVPPWTQRISAPAPTTTSVLPGWGFGPERIGCSHIYVIFIWRCPKNREPQIIQSSWMTMT